VVQLNGSELFETENCCDFMRIHDGRESDANLISFLRGNKNSSTFNHQSTGQIMEIVFKT
jgi:hypothetical protein